MITIDPADLPAYLNLLDDHERRLVSWHPIDCCLEGDPAILAKLETMTRAEIVLAYARAEKIQVIQQIASALLADGYKTTDEVHVALDDASRSDMSAMAATALASLSGASPWPDSYKLGWITKENTRIAMPKPGDGLTLAAEAGDFYARIKQHARTLKDRILAAADEAELAEIEVTAGWPNSSPDAGA